MKSPIGGLAFAAVGLALLATSAAARAQSSQDVAIPAIPDAGTSITVNQTPTTAVDIQADLSATLTGSATIQSFEQRDGTVTLSGTSNVLLRLPTVPLVGVSPAGSANGSLAAGGTSTLAFTGTDRQLGTLHGTDPLAAPLIGNGQATLGLTAATSGQLVAPLNVNTSVRSTAAADVKLTYLPAGTHSGGSSGGVITTTNPPFQFGLFGPTTALQARVVAPETTGWTQALDFGRFDPALGRLLSVNVTLDGNLTDRFTITNWADVSSSFSVTDTSTLSLDGPGGTAIVTSGLSTMESGPLDKAGSVGAMVTGADQTSDVFAQDGYDIIPSDLALFNGPGEIALYLSSIGTADAQSGSNWDLSSRGEAGATVTVDYTYDPNGAPLPATPATAVPEPPVSGLLGVGFIATFLVRSWRRAGASGIQPVA
ncbi:MAG TPA: choice-of-anchor E domain-containing protein [Acetobacteraceae bacterium]|nr:choice-of-anchor E domain-containing protein [Acetobacteraceae bacterium]